MAKKSNAVRKPRASKTEKKAPAVHIKNISRMADLEIRSALERAGIEVAASASRAELIRLASEAKLWHYAGNVVPDLYKVRYGKEQRCGDEISEVLHSATRDAEGKVDVVALAAIQKENGIDGNRWSHLNVGQQVMNTSNVVRGRARRGETAFVAGKRWN